MIEGFLVWQGQRGWGWSPLSQTSDVACHDLEPTGEKSAQRWWGGSTELPLADQAPESPEPHGLSCFVQFIIAAIMKQDIMTAPRKLLGFRGVEENS